MEPRRKLLKKPVNIMVTNHCNRACGGCSQACGHITRDRRWYITPSNLENNIRIVDKHTKEIIGLFGGEASLHPQFPQLLKILKKFKRRIFVIFSNGEKQLPPCPSNAFYCIDTNKTRRYLPTFVAPFDLLKEEPFDLYWEKAQKKCGMWRCNYSMIFRNKAYFCEVAAMFDWLTGEDHGWEIQGDKPPHDRTNEEIAKQARYFCYRCGWCLGSRCFQQPANGDTLATPTNYSILRHGKIDFVKIDRNFTKNKPTQYKVFV
jgi:hypothetical protein